MEDVFSLLLVSSDPLVSSLSCRRYKRSNRLPNEILSLKILMIQMFIVRVAVMKNESENFDLTVIVKHSW